MQALSVLDLAPVPQGSTPADALHNALDLAQHAERWGYRRYWLAEHHNMIGIASAATAVTVGYVAGGTASHPRRRRRRHAAQPLPAGDRRAVRHAGNALPGPHRPGPRPRARQRRLHAAGAAAGPVGSGHVPAGRGGAAGAARPGAAGAAGAGGAGRRNQRAAVDPRLLPLRRAGGGAFRPAIRLRLPFRAGRADAGACRSTARASSPRRSWRGRTPWWA